LQLWVLVPAGVLLEEDKDLKQMVEVHNAIIRQAVVSHAGHVITQDGASWSVAFYTPLEAVGFCLQVIVMLRVKLLSSLSHSDASSPR